MFTIIRNLLFYICLDYISSTSIDSKLFDANFVFKEVNDPGSKKPDIFHKKYETSHKRQRSGYDETLGITLRNRVTANQFITSMEPIRLLTDVNEIYFDLPSSPSASVAAVTAPNDDEPDSSSSSATAYEQKYFSHSKTTEDIKIALLGKIDFKKLLKWRQVMIEDFHDD
jgi:hypothetical protein